MEEHINRIINKQEFKDNQKFARKVTKLRAIQREQGKEFTEVKRIQSSHLFLLNVVGDGDYRRGLEKVLAKYYSTFVCPECGHKTELDEISILMSDCNLLMDHLTKFYGSNHNKHFRNFPAFFRQFLDTGKCNLKILEEQKEERRNEKQ